VNVSSWSLVSPGTGAPGRATPSGGAIAIIEVTGRVDDVLVALGLRPVEVGRVRLRALPGVDTLLIARTGGDSMLLFPHAGPAVLRRLAGALEAAGCAARDAAPRPADLDARLSTALARAASPLAIDLLLDQPRRWAALARVPAPDPDAVIPPTHAAILHRLIDPPLVAALGPPNIGKSSLLNALAGRGVAVVADLAGTTIDHVGATLDLAGLVIRYVDTPGMETAAAAPQPVRDPVLDDARRAARAVIARADLVLLCSDPTSPPVEPPPDVPPHRLLRVRLRSDLAAPNTPPADSVDVSVSVLHSRGVDDLVAAIRRRLVPDHLLTDPRPWPFWIEPTPPPP
jgi:tRNA modification GTPase